MLFPTPGGFTQRLFLHTRPIHVGVTPPVREATKSFRSRSPRMVVGIFACRELHSPVRLPPGTHRSLEHHPGHDERCRWGPLLTGETLLRGEIDRPILRFEIDEEAALHHVEELGLHHPKPDDAVV